jgi:hypothetical protein
MASLYKRATPAQTKVLRAVEGAVHNAAHAHPEFIISDRFARSIAKRATGTISAVPGLLADTPSRSKQDAALSLQGRPPTASQISTAPGASSDLVKAKSREAASTCKRRLLFFPVQTALGNLARQARKAGQQERLAALVEALRLIDLQLKD